VAVKKVLPPVDSSRLQKQLWGKNGKIPSSFRRLSVNRSSQFEHSNLRRNGGAAEDATDVHRTSDSQSDPDGHDIENQKREGAESEIDSLKNPGLRSMNAQELEKSFDDSLKRKLENPGLRSMASRLTSMTSSLGSRNRRPTYTQLKLDFVREMR
jgi:hypothetical protein